MSKHHSVLGNTKIFTVYGPLEVHSLKVGDKIYVTRKSGLSTVETVVKLQVDECKYAYQNKDICTSGDQILLIEGQSIKAKDVPKTKKVKMSNNIYKNNYLFTITVKQECFASVFTGPGSDVDSEKLCIWLLGNNDTAVPKNVLKRSNSQKLLAKLSITS